MRLPIALLAIAVIPAAASEPVLPTCLSKDSSFLLPPQVPIPYWCHIDDQDPFPGSERRGWLVRASSTSTPLAVQQNEWRLGALNPQPQQPPAPRRESPSTPRRTMRR